MLIVDKREQKLVRFVELRPGDAFNINGEVAVKTVDAKAVCLSDGNYVSRLPNDLIEPIAAKVIVG